MSERPPAPSARERAHATEDFLNYEDCEHIAPDMRGRGLFVHVDEVVEMLEAHAEAARLAQEIRSADACSRRVIELHQRIARQSDSLDAFQHAVDTQATGHERVIAELHANWNRERAEWERATAELRAEVARLQGAIRDDHHRTRSFWMVDGYEPCPCPDCVADRARTSPTPKTPPTC